MDNTTTPNMGEAITLLHTKLDALLSSSIAQKDVLTLKEVAIFTGISEGYIYQLTHRKKIPFYKPRSKMLYFKREEIEEWLLQNKHLASYEIEVMAANHLHTLKSQ